MWAIVVYHVETDAVYANCEEIVRSFISFELVGSVLNSFKCFLVILFIEVLMDLNFVECENCTVKFFVRFYSF